MQTVASSSGKDEFVQYDDIYLGILWWLHSWGYWKKWLLYDQCRGGKLWGSSANNCWVLWMEHRIRWQFWKMKMLSRRKDAFMWSAVWEIMIGITQKCLQPVKVTGNIVCCSPPPPPPPISEKENGKRDIFLSDSLSGKLWHFGTKQKTN